jgi:hypothetical protein
MSVLLVAWVLAAQLLAGWLLLAMLVPEHARRWTAALPRALLLGPLALALEMLLASALGVPFGLPVLLLPWWLLGAVVAWRRGFRVTAAPEISTAHLVALTLATALGAMALGSGLAQPLVSGDGMSNAGLSARVFETQRAVDLDAVERLRAEVNGRYPPLLALNEALLFLAAGEARVVLVKPFFALMLLALLLLLVEACFARLPPARALPAALLLLLTPLLAAGGTSGYLDELFAAQVLLLALCADELRLAPTRRRALLLAAAGAACVLTKPHGVLLALFGVAWLALLVARRRLAPRDAVPAAAALFAAVLLWPAFLAGHELPSPAVMTPDFSDPLAVAGRTLRALGYGLASVLPHDAGRFHVWGVTWAVGLPLAAVALARHASRPRAAIFLLAAAVQFGAGALTVASIPLDFEWALGTGTGRWMIHLLPWLVLAALPALEERAAEA